MSTVKSMRNRIIRYLYKSAHIFKPQIYIVSEFRTHDLPRDVERMKTPSNEVPFGAN